MEVRSATYSDLVELMEIFEGAKRIMRASGNLSQWNDGYPSEEIVLNDIKNGHCFLLCEDGEILASMALIPGPEPTYSYIEGEWPDESKYYVIHRIATAVAGRKVAKSLFDWASGEIAKHGCSTIRIDTHRDNCIMKHILAKYGFVECGVIYLANGDPRDAYFYRR